MFLQFLWTLTKVLVASLVVGTVLTHFGVTIEQVMSQTGMTPERLAELGRHAVAWAMPNVMLGALVIVPLWCLAYLLRPPRRSSD